MQHLSRLGSARRVSALALAATLAVSSCSSTGSSGTELPADSTVDEGSSPATNGSDSEPEVDVGPAEAFLATVDSASTADLLAGLAGLIGPIDGVEPLALPLDEPTTLTELVSALQSRGDELTEEQRRAVFEAVAPDLPAVATAGEGAPTASGLRSGSGSGSGLRSGVGSGVAGSGTEPSQLERAATLTERAVAEISALTGVAYPRSISVTVVDRDIVEDEGTWAVAIATNDIFGAWDTWFFGVRADTRSGPTSTAECYIFIGQAALNSPGEVGYEKIAHEVAHCFQYQEFDGTFAEFAETPAFIREGVPAWVGTTLSDGAANSQLTGWWRAYLKGNSAPSGYDLQFGNGYSAVGFYSFLADRGVNVGPQMLGLINQPAAEAFATITGDNPAVLADWGSSPTRLAEWSAAWDMAGPGIPALARDTFVETVGVGGTVQRDVPPLVNQTVTAQFTPDVRFATVQLTGVGWASWNGEAESPAAAAAQLVCFGEDCTCPDGSAPFGGGPLQRRPAGDAVTVGLGSTSTASSQLLIVAIPVEDACTPCLQGVWRQTEASVIAAMDGVIGAAPGINSITVAGSEIAKFRDGVITVSYEPQVFTASLGDNPPGTIETTFTGAWTGRYSLTGDDLTLSGVDAAVTMTQVITVGGSSNSRTEPFDPWSMRTQTAKIECQANTLVITPQGGLTTTWERISAE